MPKHLTCHSCYAKTLFLVKPCNIWLPPGHNMTTSGHIWQNKLAILTKPKHYLVTTGHTWQHLVTTWQHLVTPGNIWSPLTANIWTQTATSIVALPIKFEFPTLFSDSPGRGGCHNLEWGTPTPVSRNHRNAKTLSVHSCYAKTLFLPFPPH